VTLQRFRWKPKVSNLPAVSPCLRIHWSKLVWRRRKHGPEVFPRNKGELIVRFGQGTRPKCGKLGKKLAAFADCFDSRRVISPCSEKKNRKYLVLAPPFPVLSRKKKCPFRSEFAFFLTPALLPNFLVDFCRTRLQKYLLFICLAFQTNFPPAALFKSVPGFNSREWT
jgi:hypothetical protein